MVLDGMSLVVMDMGSIWKLGMSNNLSCWNANKQQLRPRVHKENWRALGRSDLSLTWRMNLSVMSKLIVLRTSERG